MIVLYPIVVLDLFPDGLVTDQSPFVILGVVLQRGRFHGQSVVEIGVCVTPATEDYDTKLIIEWELEKRF